MVDTQHAPAPRPDRLAAVAVVLVVLGLLLLVASRVVAGGEGHSYDGGTPPATVTLTAGHEYSIAIPDGVGALPALTGDPTSLDCAVTPPGGARTPLEVTVESADTKATNRIGRFVAPVGGAVAVTCTDLPAVFVDDADDAGTDWSGVLLLLATAGLVVGLPLLLSVLRRHFAAGREPYPAG